MRRRSVGATHGGGREAPRWPPGFARSARDRGALVVLLGLRALTPRKLLELAQDHRSAATCLAAVRAGRAGSEGDQAAARVADTEEAWAAMEGCGARLVASGDHDYPGAFFDLHDPPAGVFVRGRLPDAEASAGGSQQAWLGWSTRVAPGPVGVGVVGARNCSPEGADIARALGHALASVGVPVVSGAARGVDAEAHRGALAANGPTIAVLGCGIDQAYPSSSRRLIADIAASGAVLSEYPPGTRAEPFRFPARNRLVAALSRAVVVVEGTTDSGSLITTDHALDLGREVFAVPGPVTSELSAAPLELIRDGAVMIRGPGDLLADLGIEWDGPTDGPPLADPVESAVWRALTAPLPIEVVATRAGIPLPSATAALTRLEVKGLVRARGGRYERRLASSSGRRGASA